MESSHKKVIDYAVWLHDQVEKESFNLPLKDTGRGIKSTDLKSLQRPAMEIPSLKEIHAVYCNIVARDPNARNLTGAYSGVLGFLNPLSQKIKLKKFFRRLKKNRTNKIVFAEGDSWLEYPIFIREITDQLIRTKKYAVYSDAYGGDWIADIVNENVNLISKLDNVMPHALIISGGGNDIVGRETATKKESPQNTVLYKMIKQGVTNVDALDLNSHDGKMAFGQQCFNNGFNELLVIIHAQYFHLIRAVNLINKRDGFKILLHGYDYAIPSSQKGFGWNPLRIMKPISNLFLKNGTWLKDPLVAAGYNAPLEQQAIIYVMIERFNETLVNVTGCASNVYFIDCRNSVNPQKGWYNELHPTSRAFKDISKAFQHCIDHNPNKKHLKAIDFMQ